MRCGTHTATRPAALAVLALASCGLLLVACGQKGPLYLPDAGKQSMPQANSPAAAADSRDPDKKKSDQSPAR